MNKFHLGAVAAAMLLAGCGMFGGQDQEADPATEAVGEIATSSVRNATIAINENVITVRRSGEGEYGVGIRRAPIMVHFSVQGEGAMMRATSGGRTGEIAVGESNSVMVGPGGASNLVIYSATGDELVVTVIGVSPCNDATPCQPVQFPAGAGGAAGQPEGGEDSALRP